jgi:hypothetical protein
VSPWQPDHWLYYAALGFSAAVAAIVFALLGLNLCEFPHASGTGAVSAAISDPCSELPPPILTGRNGAGDDAFESVGCGPPRADRTARRR